MHVLLTGANGYIGSRLLQALRAQGDAVTVLGRPWRLGEAVPDEVFKGTSVDAVIHLAHDWKDDDANRRGTELLLTAARSHRVKRFVFVSSLSARADAPNRYGRVKAAVEGLLQAPAEIAARVGLVYGGPPRGLYGTMLRLTRLPIVPMIDAGQRIQPIHLDEVCLGLIAMVKAPTPQRPVYRLAAHEPMSFGDFLRLVARASHERRLRLIPVPRAAALLAADLTARLPFVPTVDRERVLGLVGIRVQESADDLGELGLALVPVEAGLRRRATTGRRLIREGAALLRYCAGAPVRKETVRLYARTLRVLDDAEPLDLPRLALRWPALLRLLDNPHRAGSALRRRLGIAARVAEAGREPAERFHMMRPVGALVVLMRLGGLMLIEAPLIVLRAVARGRS